MTFLTKTYQDALQRATLRPDPAQANVVKAMDLFITRVTKQKKKSFFSFFTKTSSDTRGLYIYGPVGRGKTMLMDWCLKALQANQIKAERWHFHEFMLKMHRDLRELKQQGGQLDNHIEQLADVWAERIQVLCFDEFHVTDVADAMMMMPLFTRLFERGVEIISTSNWAPDDLYKNGLQRQRFLPFIERLKRDMEVITLEGDTDYRSLKRKQTAAWLCPLNTKTASDFNTLFLDAAGYDPVEAEILQVGSADSARHWPIPAAAKSLAKLHMGQFLSQPMGAADFMALAERYSLLFLDDLPVFEMESSEKSKRFMVMIDVLYDRKATLVVRAAALPQDLYPSNGHLAFEFSRTVSRLNEMAHFNN